MTDFLIWSYEHKAWWKPAKRGYTTMTHAAGRYSKDEAEAIVHQANAHKAEPQEIMMPAPSTSWCKEELAYALLEPDPRPSGEHDSVVI